MPERCYKDPSRLFSIELPEGFHAVDSEGWRIFTHDDFDARVNVSCFRIDEDAPRTDLIEALPGRENMSQVVRRTEGDLQIDYGEYLGEFAGEQVSWRWWVLQRGPVAVVLSYTGNPDDDEISREPMEDFVKGLRIASPAPLSPQRFTEIAAKIYAEVLGENAPKVGRPLELVTGEESAIGLDNAYAAFLDAWESEPATDPAVVLRGWFECLWGDQAAKLGGFDEVRGLLCPVVKPADFGRSTGIEVLRRPLGESGLDVLLALDTGRTLRFLSKEDLENWEGVDEEDAFFYARENLIALCRDFSFQLLRGSDGLPRAAIFAQGDGHDAARATLPDFFDRMRKVLGENLMVGLPNRDFMIVLNADDTHLVGQVGAQVREDAKTRPYPLSGKLFRLTREGLSPLPDAGTP